MRNLDFSTCGNCGKSFGYYLVHSGSNGSCYSYCNRCGMTAILSLHSRRIPSLPPRCDPFGEIWAGLEEHLRACECGGSFKKGSSPRCPHCAQPLSAEAAASYLERNAFGTQKSWRWQRNWCGTYCIVIEHKRVLVALESANGHRKATLDQSVASSLCPAQ